MEQILVTGGLGFIGVNLFKAFIGKSECIYS